MNCVITLLLLLPCVPTNQDDAGPVDYTRELMGTQLDAELQRIRTITGLKQEGMNPVVEAAIPRLDESAKKFAKEFSSGWYPGVLPPAVTSEIVAVLTPIAGKEKTAAYETDLAARRAQLIDAVVISAMVDIDQWVLLDATQRKTIATILRKQWPNVGRNRIPFSFQTMLNQSNDGSFPPGFPEAAIRMVLEDAQQEAWAFHKQRIREQRGLAYNNVQQYAVGELAKVSQHYSLILAERYQLSPAQTRKLIVSSKGVAAAVSSRRRNLPDPPTTFEGSALRQVDPTAAILCLSKWHDKAQRFLAPEHNRKYAKNQELRGQANRDTVIRSLVSQFADSHAFTAKEQEELIKLFVKTLPPDSRGTRSLFTNTCVEMAKVTDKELSRILREPQRAGIRKWFDHFQKVVNALDADK